MSIIYIYETHIIFFTTGLGNSAISPPVPGDRRHDLNETPTPNIAESLQTFGEFCQYFDGY